MRTYNMTMPELTLPAIRALSAEIDPIQSGTGTPSPSNPRPISGRDSVIIENSQINIWNEQWEVGGINGTTGEDEPNANRFRTKGYIPVPIGENLFLYSGSSDSIGMRYYDESKAYIGSYSTTQSRTLEYGGTRYPTGTAYIRFVNTSRNEYQNDISINYPATETAYNAFKGSVNEIDLGQTVYGGTLDVTSGLLTVTHAYKSITSFASKSGTTSNHLFTYTGAQSDIKKPSADTVNANLLSDKFESVKFGGSGGLYSSATVGIGANVNGVVVVGFGLDSNFDTKDKANAWVASNPIQVVYPLATPQTYQLTPTQVETLAGSNTVMADKTITLTFNGQTLTGQVVTFEAEGRRVVYMFMPKED